MSFSAPNQRFCEVNLSFGLSRRNFMSPIKTSRARQSPMDPDSACRTGRRVPPLQKSCRACRRDTAPAETGVQRSPQEADTSHGLLADVLNIHWLRLFLDRCGSRAESPALPCRGAPTPRAEPHDRAGCDQSDPHAPGTVRQPSPRSPSLHPPQWRG